MEVIPAIDIRDGKCVRLYQGDYSRETVFSEDPVQVARRWQSEGATRLHIVDLDGAADGQPRNLHIVGALARAVRIPLELGGGIRTWESVQKALAVGVGRVVLGTAAVEQPELVRDLVRRFAESIVVGIDAREGEVAVRGWRQSTGAAAVDLARKMAELGVKRIIYTDIERDGTLTQPSFAAIEAMVKAASLAVIASGGVASVEHIRKLSKTGVEGVVVGRALYTGDVKLPEAIAAAREQACAQ